MDKAMDWSNNKESSMPVNTEVTSPKSQTRTGKVELLEFFAEGCACDDRDREIVCSDARALARGIRNALLAVAPLWLALALWLAN
jgi:hypothetical protein